MKKTLALVLALLMVLALVPTAFAKTTITYDEGNEYKVDVTAVIDPKDIDTVEIALLENGWTQKGGLYSKTFTDSDETPNVAVGVPYDILREIAGESFWDKGIADLSVTVSGLNLNWSSDSIYGKTRAVTCNGDDVTDHVAFKEDTLTFTPNLQIGVNTYDIVITGTSKESGNDHVEKVSFAINLKDTTKNNYELKFGQPDTTGVVLKDGVYFIDSTNSSYADQAAGNPANIDSFDVKVLKNNGSAFAEKAVYSFSADGYTPALQTQLVDDNSYINISGLTNKDGAVQTYYVTVETEFGIYKNEIKIRYRNNVWHVDPKGVFFDKDEYTIGVNEVFTPSYTTTVPVWHDVASIVKLSQTAYTEKGIIDCDGNKITGLREGVAYVVLTYDDKDGSVTSDGTGTPAYYTDTAKVTVKGTYQVTDKANYIVTTSSSSLNVRSGAGTKYSKIGSLAKGTVVEVVEIKDGWAKIIYPSARYTNGYVSAQYLTKQSTSPETVIGTKTVIARVLNVRSGAGTSYSIVGKLIRNTKVEVIETVANGSWSKIKFNGGYAYVSSTYIQ